MCHMLAGTWKELFFLYRFTLIMFTGRGIEGPCLSLSYNNGITLNLKLLVDFFFFYWQNVKAWQPKLTQPCSKPRINVFLLLRRVDSPHSMTPATCDKNQCKVFTQEGLQLETSIKRPFDWVNIELLRLSRQQQVPLSITVSDVFWKSVQQTLLLWLFSAGPEKKGKL